MRASETENPDLFWGVRGGGGNFGIVTEFEFRLHPVGPIVLAGPIFWPMEESPKVLRFYRDWIAEAPDELMTIVIHRKAPPLPFVPAELHGEPVVSVGVLLRGPGRGGGGGGAPLKEFGSPVLDLCEPKPYLEHQAMFDASFPHGWWYYMRACDVAELTRRGDRHHGRARDADPLPADRVPDLAARRGGGARRRGRDGLQRPRRRATPSTSPAARKPPRASRPSASGPGRFWSALEPHHTSVYVNFLMDEGEERDPPGLRTRRSTTA